MGTTQLIVGGLIALALIAALAFFFRRRIFTSRRQESMLGSRDEPVTSDANEWAGPPKEDEEEMLDSLRGVRMGGIADEEKAAPAPQPSAPTPQSPPAAGAAPRRRAAVPPAASSDDGVSQPKKSPSADVDGDVHGDVNVAGGDIIIVNPQEARKYEKQARRFDAAFPEKVEHKKTATLWVGVTLPDAPPPFEGVPAGAITTGPAADVPMPVDARTGELQEVQIDVRVRAPGFDPSSDTGTLTVYPDGKADKVRFLLEAEDEGEGLILVQFYVDRKRLGEIEFKSVVEKARSGQRFALTLQVASIYLAFGVA